MVAIFALDKHRNCQFLNAVAEVLTGASLAQVRGLPFAQVVWRNKEVRFEETSLAAVLQSGGGGEGEQRIIGADGIARWFAFRVVAVRIGEGAVIIELTDLSGETGTARALRESEQRLRLAVEATGIGIWDINARTGVRRWSERFCQILGLPADTPADSETFFTLTEPRDRDRVRHLYAAAIASSEGSHEAEFQIRMASDGAQRWVQITGKVTFDENGQPVRGNGILRDTTERREVEETLRKREEQLRIALAAGRMGTWRWNLMTGEQQWDDTQFLLLGLPPDQAPTRALFLAVVHPDDVAQADIDVSSLPVGDGFLDFEYRVVWPNGEQHWISQHALLRYDADGQPFEMIGVSYDITSQKNAVAALRISEERHRLAVEANNVGTWDYDLASGEYRWSDQCLQLWGLPPDTPNDRELLRALVTAEDWFVIEQQWRAALDPQGDGRIAVECPIRRADDSARRWCAFSGQVFFDDQRRKPLRAVGIMQDITDRREGEERQRMMLREMNHRVKNSLAVVQAIVSQTIQMTPDPTEAFERIESRVMSVARTHDFLDRSSFGEASIRQLITVEMEPFVDDMASRLRMGGPVVLLDSSAVLALGLTIHELATNSVKYGALSIPTGRIEVSWHARGEGDQTSVDMEWKEVGGQPVLPPRRRGFGSRLIEGSVAGTLGGSVKIEYDPGGIIARLSFPIRAAAS